MISAMLLQEGLHPSPPSRSRTSRSPFRRSLWQAPANVWPEQSVGAPSVSTPAAQVLEVPDSPASLASRPGPGHGEVAASLVAPEAAAPMDSSDARTRGPVLSAPPPPWSRASPISSVPSATSPIVTPFPIRTVPNEDAADSEITPPKPTSGLPTTAFADQSTDNCAGSPMLSKKRPASSIAVSPSPSLQSRAKASPSPTPVGGPRVRSSSGGDSHAMVRARGNQSSWMVQSGGPAPSLGSLLERLDHPPASPLSPLKKPRTPKWMMEMRGTALMEVPLTSLTDMEPSRPQSEDGEAPRRYPRRTRIPPLEFWRNERAVYKREIGSDAPSLCSVVLNYAPRSEFEKPRKMPLQAVPLLNNNVGTEFIGADNEALLSKLVILPPWQSGKNPPTHVLPALSIGLIYMIEGSLRCAYEGHEDVVVLNGGDVLKLCGGDRELLLASAGMCGTSTGAKFKVFLIKTAACKVVNDVSMAPLTI